MQSWPKVRALRVALEAADRESRRRPSKTAADAPDGDAGTETPNPETRTGGLPARLRPGAEE